MKTKFRNILFVLAASLSASTQTSAAPAAAAATLTNEQAREEQACATAIQACLWGEPFRMYTLYGPIAIKTKNMGLNFYAKHTELKTAADHFVVTPNNVTIDAYAYTDLSKEPVVVFVPPSTDKRWYIVQFGNCFDEVIHNAAGTKGPQPGAYIITGPDYRGPIPGDMIQVKCNTNIGMSAVRIYVSGKDDLPAAIEFQKGFALMPLSAFLRDGLGAKPAPITSPFATFQSAAPKDLRALDQIGFLMTQALPASADQNDPLVASFHAINLSAARGFEWQTLDAATRRGVVRGIKIASQIIDNKWANIGTTVNGWKYTFGNGRPGDDLALRAALARGVTGAEIASEVIYPNTTVDSAGEQLNGAHKYKLHFPAGQLPPVTVFWNLNMFGEDMFFVENPFKRYSIGSTTDGIKKNADGSLSILIQNERPADTSNWLPAPKGNFNLTLRFYGPGPSVLDGTYRIPAVQKAD